MDSDLVVTPIIDNPKVWKDALTAEGWAFRLPWELEPWWYFYYIYSLPYFLCCFSCLLLCHLCHVSTFLMPALSVIFSSSCTAFCSLSGEFLPLLHQLCLPAIHGFLDLRPLSSILCFSIHTWVNFSKYSSCECVRKADVSEHCSPSWGGWVGHTQTTPSHRCSGPQGRWWGDTGSLGSHGSQVHFIPSVIFVASCCLECTTVLLGDDEYSP